MHGLANGIYIFSLTCLKVLSNSVVTMNSCCSLYVSEFLSLVLQLKVLPIELYPRNPKPLVEQLKGSNIFLLSNLFKFKEEAANCPNFSRYITSGIDIFVNDALSQSHRILASTVGVTGFCYSCIAGFRFEEDLHQLKQAFRTTRNPYVAIVCCYLI